MILVDAPQGQMNISSEDETGRDAIGSNGFGDVLANFNVLTDAMPQMVWSTRPDGFHDYYNARWYEFTGTRPGSTDGDGWNDMFHPGDASRLGPSGGTALRPVSPTKWNTGCVTTAAHTAGHSGALCLSGMAQAGLPAGSVRVLISIRPKGMPSGMRS